MGHNGRGCGLFCCCGDDCSCSARKLLYVFGLLVLILGCITSLVGFFDSSWVYREGGGVQTAATVDHYGLWSACSPAYFDTCQVVFDAMPNIEGGARGSQALITLAILFYVFCTVVEILSCFPCGLKQRLNIIFENRIIEYVIAVASVVGFLGMLVFAGEVKNKAVREIGQVDYTGSGLSWSLSGHLLVVIGCCLMACGRNVNADGMMRV